MRKHYQIRAALGGGFGGVENANWETIEAETLEEAEEEARFMAIEIYDRYVGMYGLRDVDQIVEEDGVDKNDAEIIFTNERDDWLDYEAREFVAALS